MSVYINQEFPWVQTVPAAYGVGYHIATPGPRRTLFVIAMSCLVRMDMATALSVSGRCAADAESTVSLALLAG